MTPFLDVALMLENHCAHVCVFKKMEFYRRNVKREAANVKQKTYSELLDDKDAVKDTLCNRGKNVVSRYCGCTVRAEESRVDGDWICKLGKLG